MKKLAASLRELAGLFVAVAGIVAALAPSASWLAGLILLCGCLGVLIGNVAMAK